MEFVGCYPSIYARVSHATKILYALFVSTTCAAWSSIKFQKCGVETVIKLTVNKDVLLERSFVYRPM